MIMVLGVQSHMVVVDMMTMMITMIDIGKGKREVLWIFSEAVAVH